MRAAGLAAALALSGAAAQACPMTLALYADTATGTELRIRTPAPWEGASTYAIELALRDGRVLWGRIGQNLGTSRDLGQLYSGCDRPGPEDMPLSEETAAACMAWEGVVYALQDGTVGALPQPAEKAPESLILTDLGRKLRYAVFDGPGDEPWDQFLLHGCAE